VQTVIWILGLDLQSCCANWSSANLTTATCQQRWQTTWMCFLGVEQKTVGLSCTKPITTKQQSVFWSVSQSQLMLASFIGSCRWLSLAAASGDTVIATLVDSVLIKPMTHLRVFFRKWLSKATFKKNFQMCHRLSN